MKRSFWGWGSSEFLLDPSYIENYLPLLRSSFGVQDEDPMPVPDLEKIHLSEPAILIPPDLAIFCTSSNEDRLGHTYGKSFRDVWRALHGQWDAAPDYVAYPKNEDHLTRLFEYAGKHDVALIPFGGGSSVCGGVERPRNEKYAAAISVDMKHFNQVLEIDRASRSALIQAGCFGPQIESQLKPHGYTLRHYPQSFEFSTLGGWIATRSGGHYATLFTHIDEFVQNVRMITPTGIIDTKKLPGHGAGPSEERFYCGSEGILGIITQAWMRIQDIPKFKTSSVVNFDSFGTGVKACRRLAQSGLHPSNARLVDAVEALSNRLGDGQHAVLILGFESHENDVDEKMSEALRLMEEMGGKTEKPVENSKHKKSDKADNWKNAFFKAPYLRDELIRYGFVIETFETSITWERFDQFHKEIIRTTQEAIEKYCGVGFVTTRFTHLYSDGPAPYYTAIAKGRKGHQLDQWDGIKEAVSSRIVELGGAITHHHAVGKDHLPYYEKQRTPLFGEVLKSAKKTLDPNGILNPGTLLR